MGKSSAERVKEYRQRLKLQKASRLNKIAKSGAERQRQCRQRAKMRKHFALAEVNQPSTSQDQPPAAHFYAPQSHFLEDFLKGTLDLTMNKDPAAGTTRSGAEDVPVGGTEETDNDTFEVKREEFQAEHIKTEIKTECLDIPEETTLSGSNSPNQEFVQQVQISDPLDLELQDQACLEQASTTFHEVNDPLNCNVRPGTCDHACVCIICNLLKKGFYQLSIEEQRQVIEAGRPQPRMDCLTPSDRRITTKGGYNERFNVKNYDKYPWLTGSQVMKKLFCWYCLLFGSDSDPPLWGRDGYKHLLGLPHMMIGHSISQSHISAFVKFAMFRKSLGLKMDKPYESKETVHNEMVGKNRDILRRLIDSVCLMAILEMRFQSHDKNESIMNHAVYLQFVKFISDYDHVLRNHLETGTSFKATSMGIKNDLIDSIATVVLNEIKREVASTQFVSILLVESSVATNVSRMSTVLRYVDEAGIAQERFVGYKDYCCKKSAATLFVHIAEVVKEFKLLNKLVAQSYAGASLEPTQLHELYMRVQHTYPPALFTDCFPDKIKLVLREVSLKTEGCHLFFSIFPGLEAFFAKFSKRQGEWKVFMSEEWPDVSISALDFELLSVDTVWTFLPQLIQFFNNVIANSGNWDIDTLIAAHGFQALLTNLTNIFLLVVFAKLFAITKELYTEVEKIPLDVAYPKARLTKMLVNSQLTHKHFDKIWEEVKKKCEECDIDISQLQPKSKCETLENTHKRLFCAITNHIPDHISDHHECMEKLVFMDLLNPDKFYDHTMNFPEKSFRVLIQFYSSFFNFVGLRNELVVMYGLYGFKDMLPHKLASYMRLFELEKGLPELYKLACLFLTIPSIKASEEPSFPAVKRIESCMHTMQRQDQQLSLALISIEKNLLRQLQTLPDFYNKVADELAREEVWMAFRFK